jgi:hypothetical protein
MKPLGSMKLQARVTQMYDQNCEKNRQAKGGAGSPTVLGWIATEPNPTPIAPAVAGPECASGKEIKRGKGVPEKVDGSKFSHRWRQQQVLFGCALIKE